MFLVLWELCADEIGGGVWGNEQCFWFDGSYLQMKLVEVCGGMNSV